MKNLSCHLIGRLGNLMFIYAYARGHAEQFGYRLCTPPWIGEQIFCLPECPRPEQVHIDYMLPEATYQNQYALDAYTRNKVRQWFQLRPEIEAKLKVLDTSEPEMIFNRREMSDCPIIVSRESYFIAANQFGYLPEDAQWETDACPTRLPEFSGSETAAGLGTTWVALPSFYRLMKAKVLFRANSTFSWWAATLGDGKVYSPVVKDIKDGHCRFVEGNWPVMSPQAPNTDLHLRSE